MTKSDSLRGLEDSYGSVSGQEFLDALDRKVTRLAVRVIMTQLEELLLLELRRLEKRDSFEPVDKLLDQLDQRALVAISERVSEKNITQEANLREILAAEFARSKPKSKPYLLSKDMRILGV